MKTEVVALPEALLFIRKSSLFECFGGVIAAALVTPIFIICAVVVAEASIAHNTHSIFFVAFLLGMLITGAIAIFYWFQFGYLVKTKVRDGDRMVFNKESRMISHNNIFVARFKQVSSVYVYQGYAEAAGRSAGGQVWSVGLVIDGDKTEVDSGSGDKPNTVFAQQLADTIGVKISEDYSDNLSQTRY